MDNAFSIEENYQQKIEEYYKTTHHTIDLARNIRNDYKCIVGEVLYKILPRNYLPYITEIENQVTLCDLARQSTVFNECDGTISCILRELKPNGRRLRGVQRTKAAFNAFYKTARKESRHIRQIYELANTQDKKYKNDEYIKLKKALFFLRIVLSTSLYAKLPTILSQTEYNDLVACCNEQIVAERYRFDAAANVFFRIGKQPRTPAFKLFGFNGTVVLIRKAMSRVEHQYNALHR